MEHILDALFAFAMAVELTFYGPNPPETLDERRDRIEMIVEVDTEVSHSIDSEFDPRDAAALLLTTQIGESKLEYYVHAGLKSPIGHQDHGKARCLGQLHTWPGNRHLPTAEDHRALAGLDREATKRCASTMLKYLWGHASRCIRRDMPVTTRWDKPLADHEVVAIFAAYGIGRCSDPTKSNRARAGMFRRLRRSIGK